MLDLYAGLGGQSEGFLQSHDVLRLDNNPILQGVERMIILDVRTLPEQIFDVNGTAKIQYVHASPPCTEFSLGFNAPRSKAIREGNGDTYKPDMTDVFKAIEIIKTLKPTWWSLENVKGSIKYITPLLGEPRFKIGPYVYWGNFPIPSVKYDAQSMGKMAKSNHLSSANPLRANIRGKIPLEISKAFAAAMSSQKSISDY